MHRRTLELMETLLRKEYPSTLASVCLVHTLGERHQLDEANILYQRAAMGFKEALGSQHPLTVACERDYRLILERRDQS